MNRTLRFFSSAGLLVLLACGRPPEIHHYLLDTPLVRSPQIGGKYPVILGVKHFEGGPLFEDDRLVYRTSEVEAKFYHYRRWIAPPTALVTDAFITHLDGAGLFQRVMRYPATQAPELLLSGRILSFEEFDEGNTWYARIRLELTLERLSDGAVLFRQNLFEQQPVKTQEPTQVVIALNACLKTCLQRFTEVLDQRLAAMSAL